MVTVKFVGGPRDGKTKKYPHDPLRLGCHDEAEKVGMFGLYVTDGTVLNRASTGEVIATWREIQRKPRSLKP